MLSMPPIINSEDTRVTQKTRNLFVDVTGPDKNAIEKTIAVIACGLAEVYLRPRSRPEYRDCIWDHAAGTAVVEAAGGRVSDLDGRPLDFTRGTRLEGNRGVLASNGHIHGPVLEALAALGG